MRLSTCYANADTFKLWFKRLCYRRFHSQDLGPAAVESLADDGCLFLCSEACITSCRFGVLQATLHVRHVSLGTCVTESGDTRTAVYGVEVGIRSLVHKEGVDLGYKLFNQTRRLFSARILPQQYEDCKDSYQIRFLWCYSLSTNEGVRETKSQTAAGKLRHRDVPQRISTLMDDSTLEYVLPGPLGVSGIISCLPHSREPCESIRRDSGRLVKGVFYNAVFGSVNSRIIQCYSMNNV